MYYGFREIGGGGYFSTYMKVNLHVMSILKILRIKKNMYAAVTSQRK